MPFHLQELGDEILTAAIWNKVADVVKWLYNLPLKDISTRQILVQVIQNAARYLSVDVIGIFEPPSKNYFRF